MTLSAISSQAPHGAPGIGSAPRQVSIIKESGARGRVLDRRCWPMKDLGEAVKMFERRIAQKTNQERKSPRKYIVMEEDV